MKEPNGRRSEKFDEFEKRAQRILDRLDQADRILDNLQAEKRKPDKITDTLQGVFESAEGKLRKIFSQLAKPSDEQRQSISHESLVHYLLSCSDDQLIVIRDEIDRILKNREST